MILKILTDNNPALRQKAEKVKEITAEIKRLVLDMIEIMEKNEGLGLAANQVGKLLRIIIIEPEPNQKAIVLINPEIKRKSWKKEEIVEGCLSLPEIYLSVKRPVKITVEALDINGEKIKIKAEGLLARIIQHETDHLNGILIVDK